MVIHVVSPLRLISVTRRVRHRARPACRRMLRFRRLGLCTDRYGRRTHLREGQARAVQQFSQGLENREVTLDADHLMFVDERGREHQRDIRLPRELIERRRRGLCLDVEVAQSRVRERLCPEHGQSQTANQELESSPHCLPPVHTLRAVYQSSTCKGLPYG